MILILIDLPNQAYHKEIEQFTSPAIKNGYMGSVAIIAQQHPKTHVIKYHALVRITPDAVAKQAIEELNGTLINGKPIDVHEYRTRYWHNDPRIRSTRSKLTNLRKGERRQFL